VIFTDPPVKSLTIPLIQNIQLDHSFAWIGTWSMLGKLIISFLKKDKPDNEDGFDALEFIDEMLKKVRQLCQYSIHARPGFGLRKPDDIASDAVHNIEAFALGKSVYNLNAFWAPWLGLAKPLLDKSLFGGIPLRFVEFVDDTIGKITNMFWNIRRISLGLIPYDGGTNSESLAEKQEEVRSFVGYMLSNYLLKPLGIMNKRIFGSFLDLAQDLSYNFNRDKFYDLLRSSAKNYWGNIKALFSARYECPHENGKTKIIGEEEPENHHLYVRSKILSKLMSFWAGLGGTMLNSSSMGLDLIAKIFNSEKLQKTSNYLTDLANGLMACVYMTGEIPANINEFYKKWKANPRQDYRNLFVAGIGFLGMLYRMRVVPGISFAMKAIGIKPILEQWSKQLENLFLLFFSYNRLVLHNDERKRAEAVSSIEDIHKTESLQSLTRQMILPLRVLLKDPEVTYPH
jgi:hypothetical protein